METYSANEISALVERAMRGAGLPLSHASLLSSAAVWGELRGLSVLGALVDLVANDSLSDLADLAVALCDRLCQEPQLEVNVSPGGEANADKLAARKRLLAACLAQCPVPEGQLLYLEAGGTSLILGASQQWRAAAGDGSGLVARWMAQEEADGLMVLGGYRALAAALEAAYSQGVTVDRESIIAPLAELAYRTYVPATEASRQQAGAGETDND